MTVFIANAVNHARVRGWYVRHGWYGRNVQPRARVGVGYPRVLIAPTSTPTVRAWAWVSTKARKPLL